MPPALRYGCYSRCKVEIRRGAKTPFPNAQARGVTVGRTPSPTSWTHACARARARALQGGACVAGARVRNWWPPPDRLSNPVVLGFEYEGRDTWNLQKVRSSMGHEGGGPSKVAVG